MITREQINAQSVTKLNSLEEAHEFINMLTYSECIACLKGVKRMPADVLHALTERAKEEAGGTNFEIIEAVMQAVANS